jgi:uncharacterized protein YecE (DUF72 family)
VKGRFSPEGTHLERYAGFFSAVEINSSFYREHMPATYAKWSACVPDDFRFAVKLSREFTHITRLEEAGTKLKESLAAIAHLGEKWGVLLVQLPPSLIFQEMKVESFIGELRDSYEGDIAWEPRHITWASEEAAKLFEKYEISRVFADPEPCPTPPALRARMELFKYIRLHGTPEIYKSRYSPEMIELFAETIRGTKKQSWCIFDNTTFGYATENAMELTNLLREERQSVLTNEL